MVDTLFLLAAAAEAAEEGSPFAFYALGGALTLWAIAVSALGISRRSSFPGTNRGRDLVTLVTVVLVIGTCASSALTG